MTGVYAEQGEGSVAASCGGWQAVLDADVQDVPCLAPSVS